MKKIIWPALLVVFAAILWGVDGSVLRPSLYHLLAKVVVFAEHFIAFFIMIIIVLLVIIFKFGKAPEWLKKDIQSIKNLPIKGWYAIAWIAFFGGMVGTIAIVKALFYVNFIPLSIPILVQKLQPIFGIILAIFILKERPKKSFYLWVIIALLGSYLVTFGFARPIISLENKALMAALFGLIAAFSWGSSTVFGKAALKGLTYRAATFLRFGVTSIFVFILLLSTGSLSGIADITMNQFWIILIIAFTSGGTAMFIYYKGLQRIKASTSTILELAFPITVIVLDYVIRGSIMSIPQFVGAALIIISILRITKDEKPKTQVEEVWE